MFMYLIIENNSHLGVIKIFTLFYSKYFRVLPFSLLHLNGIESYMKYIYKVYLFVQ